MVEHCDDIVIISNERILAVSLRNSLHEDDDYCSLSVSCMFDNKRFAGLLLLLGKIIVVKLFTKISFCRYFCATYVFFNTILRRTFESERAAFLGLRYFTISTKNLELNISLYFIFFLAG